MITRKQSDALDADVNLSVTKYLSGTSFGKVCRLHASGALHFLAFMSFRSIHRELL